MKSYIKFFLGAAALSMGLSSCVNDLDQLPQDPNTLMYNTFTENPKQYIGGMMAKCYSGLAVSGQDGAGNSEISSPDAGMSQYTRAIYMANEFPTDETLWIYSSDAGVADFVQTNWSAGNPVVDLVYSRLYTHISVCNTMISFNPGDYGISIDDQLAKDLEQFKLEARALRDYSYFNVIDIFGRAAVAWDDVPAGEEPLQAASRAALYDKVVADLEDVLSKFPETKPVYGRIGKDAVRAILMRFYLNAEVFTEGRTKAYDKAFNMAQEIINRHQGGGFQGSGLANDYLSLFCGNNHIFVAGADGELSDQNEILFNVPQEFVYTESYGASNFLAMATTFGGVGNVNDMSKGFCDPSWYGITNPWGCMHARTQFSQKFNFVGGKSTDKRAMLWLTDAQGWAIDNDEYANLQHGYLNIKFTNVECNADGSMPVYQDQTTGLTRIGKADPVSMNFVNTDMPIIRLAEVYLSAAEAALRGGGSTGDGLKYANYVRQRAGVPAWNAAEFTLNNIIDERARELYHEGVRRTDLIRFGLFTGNAYVWNWKGGQANGTYISDRYKVYPIPTNVISAYNSEYVQNPNY